MESTPQIKLGLVCLLENKLSYSYKTMTRKAYLGMNRVAANNKLCGIILHNVENLERICHYCVKEGIPHLRISSSMFPLFGEEQCGISWEELGIKSEVEEKLAKIGSKLIPQLSLSSHPSQFSVLFNSDERITRNSIYDLEMHAWLHDALGLPQNLSNPINIHPSGKHELEIFRRNFLRCSSGVRNRLTLENTDCGIWNVETLAKFHKECAGVGLTFGLCYDNLHQEINGTEKDREIFDYFARTFGTFPPVFHWSEGINNTKSHARLPSKKPIELEWGLERGAIWELECKGKQNVIEEARRILTRS